MKTRAAASPVMLCSLLLVSGIIMGILGLRVLSPDEKAELASYLEVFMRGLSNPGLEPPVILRLSLAHNLKTVALMWAFGLAVIGAPLTCIMLFIRGFALGFSSAFVIKQVPQGGFLIFAAGMLPTTWLPCLPWCFSRPFPWPFPSDCSANALGSTAGCSSSAQGIRSSSPLCPSCCWPLRCWKHTSHPCS